MSILPDIGWGSRWIDLEGDLLVVFFVTPTLIHYVFPDLPINAKMLPVKHFKLYCRPEEP